MAARSDIECYFIFGNFHHHVWNYSLQTTEVEEQNPRSALNKGIAHAIPRFASVHSRAVPERCAKLVGARRGSAERPYSHVSRPISRVLDGMRTHSHA